MRPLPHQASTNSGAVVGARRDLRFPTQDTVVLPYLAPLLDEPLALRKPRTGHTASQRLSWHCTIRNTTGVELDDDWFELTREVLDATGIEPYTTTRTSRAPPARTSPTTTASTSRGDRRHLSPISGRAKSRILRTLSP